MGSPITYCMVSIASTMLSLAIFLKGMQVASRQEIIDMTEASRIGNHGGSISWTESVMVAFINSVHT